MTTHGPSRRWILRLIYLLIASFLLFLQLLPLSTEPTRLPGPDLLLCLTLVWLLRRPDVVTAPLVVLVFFVTDLVCMNPPGLFALLTLLGTEFLRDRAQALRGLPFFVEWAMVAVIVTLMTLAGRLITTITMIPQPKLSLILLQLMMTIIAYPVVAGVSRLIFGQRLVGSRKIQQRRLNGRRA